jgi:hypothetical protein
MRTALVTALAAAAFGIAGAGQARAQPVTAYRGNPFAPAYGTVPSTYLGYAASPYVPTPYTFAGYAPTPFLPTPYVPTQVVPTPYVPTQYVPTPYVPTSSLYVPAWPGSTPVYNLRGPAQPFNQATTFSARFWAGDLSYPAPYGVNSWSYGGRGWNGGYRSQHWR